MNTNDSIYHETKINRYNGFLDNRNEILDNCLYIKSLWSLEISMTSCKGILFLTLKLIITSIHVQ